MMDLTGCPTTSYSFKDEKVKQMIDSGKFWELMKHFDDEGYLLTGGTPAEEMWSELPQSEKTVNGIIPGHAYSIIACKEAKG